MPIRDVIHVNQQSIDRVLQAGAPVLLVFWQPAAPLPATVDNTLDQLAESYAGKALIAKVNAADEPGIAQRFAVNSLPAAVLVRSGRSDAVVPQPAADQLRGWLAYAVDGGPRPAQPAVQNATGSAATGGGDKPVVLTDATFQQAVAGPTPILVDFWAPWCGPCRMVAPSVEQLAQEFQGRALVGKLNVDENPITAHRFQVMSIPTLLIFKNGQVVDELIGAQPYQVLKQRLGWQIG